MKWFHYSFHSADLASRTWCVAYYVTVVTPVGLPLSRPWTKMDARLNPSDYLTRLVTHHSNRTAHSSVGTECSRTSTEHIQGLLSADRPTANQRACTRLRKVPRPHFRKRVQVGFVGRSCFADTRTKTPGMEMRKTAIRTCNQVSSVYALQIEDLPRKSIYA